MKLLGDWLQRACLSAVSASVLSWLIPLSADISREGQSGLRDLIHIVQSQATFVSAEAPGVPIDMLGVE